MGLLDWYREFRDIRHCESCETLRQQLELANYEKQQMLSKLLNKESPAPIIESQPIEVSVPKMIPWNVRKQMLEREDREKARSLRNAAAPDSEIEKKSIEELEKDLDIAAAEREKQTS